MVSLQAEHYASVHGTWCDLKPLGAPSVPAPTAGTAVTTKRKEWTRLNKGLRHSSPANAVPPSTTHQGTNLMEPSAFNAEDFEQSLTIRGPLATRFNNIPTGTYLSYCTGHKLKIVQTKNGPRLILELSWTPDDEVARRVTGMQKPTARQSIWLDTTPDLRALEEGDNKNVDLGRVLDALSLNHEGFHLSMLDERCGLATYEPDGDYVRVTKVVSPDRR